MKATLGGFAVFLALGVALYGMAAAVMGARTRRRELLASAECAAVAVFGLTSLAVLLMELALIGSDFSIRYVATTSSLATPIRFKVAGLWGALEGSILLWEWMLALYTCLVLIFFRGRNRELVPYVLSVLLGISAFFLLVMSFSSRPFERLFPVPPDGRGMNPLLENTNMLSHPIFLYLGYVGFSVPYAFAMAALITGRLTEEWLMVTRRWTVLAWFFLSVGIVYGGWWSYQVLGWGGYWAWDPVENASFLPWLTGTAFVHSVMIQERRRMLKVWNLTLIILTFSLVFFGTFLTRSGVIASVHAFTQGTIGAFFLAFLALILLFSVGLIVYRADQLRGTRGELDSLISRESAFLMNNLLLVGGCFTVFLGTIFPLLAEVVTGAKISVGTPFFNRVFVPIGLGLLLLMGVGPLVAWRRATLGTLRRNFLLPGLLALASGVAAYAAGIQSGSATAAALLSVFVFSTVVQEFARGVRERHASLKESIPRALVALALKNRRRYGGLIVHLGVVLIVIGITGSQGWNIQREVTLKLGETMEVGRYRVQFDGLRAIEAGNHIKVSGDFTVFNRGGVIGHLSPGQRFYPSQDQPFADSAFRSTWREDLYLILGAFERDGTSATVKALVNPMVLWIWLGGGVVVLGAIVALFPAGLRARSP